MYVFHFLFFPVPKCSRYVYFVRSHLQCETVDVVEAALKDTNKQEKEASSAVSSHGKKKGVSGKSATMSHFEQLSSQFMSFISNEQEKGKHTHSYTYVTEVHHILAMK